MAGQGEGRAVSSEPHVCPCAEEETLRWGQVKANGPMTRSPGKRGRTH